MSPPILAAEYVADTVALVVYLEKRQLVADASVIFDSAENSTTIIHIPAIVFAEILYLSEKGRISANPADVKNLLQTNPNFRECPLTQAIIETTSQIIDLLLSFSRKFLNIDI